MHPAVKPGLPWDLQRSLAPCLRRGLPEPQGVHQGALPQLLFPVYYAYHRSLSTLTPAYTGQLPNWCLPRCQPSSTLVTKVSRSLPNQVELIRCLGCFHPGVLRPVFLNRYQGMVRLSALVRLWIGDVSSQRYIHLVRVVLPLRHGQSLLRLYSQGPLMSR